MKKKVLAILLSLTMVLSLFPASVVSAGTTSEFSDMPSDWSTAALQNAVNNGLLSGYDGKIMPKKNMTRAQMASVINRAFGTTEKVSLSRYTDVAANAWYYNDMAKAVQMKTFVGSGGKLRPDSSISREEAFVVLASAFKLSEAPASVLDKFSDKAMVSSWAKDATASLIAAGYIAGSNGRLNPKQNINRAEFAQIMDNLLKNYIKTSGTYTTDYTGNVMINVAGVTLKDIKITGDLIIGDGVGNGDVILDGITVTGNTIIRGGGVNSIKIIGKSNLQNIIIARIDGQVRVYSADGIEIGEVIVDGSDNVTIEGSFEAVTVTAPDITVTATSADIVNATINGDRSVIIVRDISTIETAIIEGDNAKVISMTGTKIGDITVKGDGAAISGTGTIRTVDVNGNNTSVTTPGTSVTAAPGSTGNIAGTKPVAGGATEIVPNIVVYEGSSGSGNGNSSGDEAATVAVSAINVTGAASATTVIDGGTLQMSAAIVPVNATNQTIVWSVATLVGGTATINGSTGLLTATGVGTVTVTATNVASGVTGTKDIAVTPAEAALVLAYTNAADAATFVTLLDANALALTLTNYTGLDATGKTEVGSALLLVDTFADKAAVQSAVTTAIAAAKAGSDARAAEAALVLAYTNAADAATFVTLLDANVLTLTLTNYAGLDATGKTEVGTAMLAVDTFADKAAVQSAVTTAIANAFYTYTTTNNLVTITGYTGADAVITIPSTLGGNPVTIIGTGAFISKTTLTSVTIPNSVTSIGEFAFADCTKLTSVTIPNSVTSIGNSAFFVCTGLTSVTIGSSVTRIGDSAFSYCTKLTSVTIPNSVIGIGAFAFNSCDELTSVIIGSSVTSIGEYAFIYCTKLTSVTIPDSVTSIGESAFKICTSLTSVTIGSSVTRIGEKAFFECTKLTSVTIPDSVISIGAFAFYSCEELTSAIIGSSVTSIGEEALLGCTKLTSITMRKTGTAIGNHLMAINNDNFRTAYNASGEGTYTGTLTGAWTR